LIDVLTPAADGPDRTAQLERWTRNDEAARLYDRAHALFLWGEAGAEPFLRARAKLLESFPRYAPFRFLEREYQAGLAETPRPIAYADFPVLTPSGTRRVLRISAVTMRIGDARAVVMFVDNDKREIYGQRYYDGPASETDREIERFTAETLSTLQAAYEEAAAAHGDAGLTPPGEAATAARLKARVESGVERGR